MQPIIVAAVGYTNAWPLLTRLDRIEYQVVEGHPSAVARMLEEGQADVGLVPVAALLTDGDYRVIPQWCIGGEGPVHSVLLVAETPPEQWTKVVLDGVSRTSVVLAQLVLTRGPLAESVQVEFVHAEPGRALEQAGGTVASLVIGDAARELPEHLGVRLDLGQAWMDWTGLPFVFAVWAGRPDLPVRAIEGLRRAAAEGMELRSALPEPDRTYVLEQIRYELDDRAMMGLRRFAALAAEEGLVGTQEFRLYGPSSDTLPRAELGRVLERAVQGSGLTREELTSLGSRGMQADLAAAASLRREAVLPGEDVSYILGDSDAEVPWIVQLRLGAESLEERVARLLALRSLQDSGSEILAVQVIGACSTEAGRTAADWLRWVALARLALPDVRHVSAIWEGDLGTAQAALWAGADDLGPVREEDQTWSERNLRQAGFTPVVRNTRFEKVGAAQTRAAWSPDRPRVR
jgi:chorismate dehydratase